MLSQNTRLAIRTLHACKSCPETVGYFVLYRICTLYSASRSAHQSKVLSLTHLGGADAVVLQSNCVRRTCSRSLYSCLGRGFNSIVCESLAKGFYTLIVSYS